MIEIISELIRHMLTLIFGIVVSAMFLDIRTDKKNIGIICTFFALLGILQGLLYYSADIEKLTMLYPLITHLPLLVLFTTVLKKRIFPSIIAISAAYMNCQIANWMSAIPVILEANNTWVNVIYSGTLIITLILITKYMAEPLAGLLNKPDKTLIPFSIVPVAYYLFDYVSTVYTELLYEGAVLAVEFSPLLLCILYITFCTTYFKQYEQRQEADNRNRLIQMKYDHSKKEVETVKRSEKNIALIRHDMRHFMAVLLEYIDNEEIEKAKNYINEVVESMDNTVHKKYCSNENINMILSCYEEELIEKNIRLNYNIDISEVIKVPNIDMTSILSNCLENAINAVSLMEAGKERQIDLTIVEKNEKLLISVENLYEKKPDFVGGMPVSREKNHGLGTQSIRYTTEKLGGNCQFSAKDGKFVVRIVL